MSEITKKQCEYYYGCQNSKSWFEEPYEVSLKVQIHLAEDTLQSLTEAAFPFLDVERMNRIDKRIKELKAQLSLK